MQQMGIAALIMGFSILISRFMGLIRDKVISWQFGAGMETDIYFAAFVIPDFLNYLLAGGYVSITLIPILSKLFEKAEREPSIENSRDPWQLFGAIFLWASGLILFFSVLAWIFAPQLAPYLAPGFNEEQTQRLTSFLRIILPAQVCFIPGACFSALLYIRKKFVVPALMPLIYNGCILLLGVSFPYFGISEGMEGFCYGVLLGAFLGAVVLPFWAVKRGGLKWEFSLYHPRLKHIFLLTLPLMLGQSIVVLDEQFIRIFGSLAEEGDVSLLSYARRIMMVPVGVVAQAAGVASFPFLAQLLAEKKETEFGNTLNSALKNSLIIVLPITCAMIVLAGPILGLIFEGGRFGQSETLMATPLLQIMMLAVPFWVVQQIVSRAFYAAQNTVTPAITGSVVTLLFIPLYIYISNRYGAFSIALLTSLSVSLYTLALSILAYKKFQKTFESILCVFGKNMLLNVIPTVLCYLSITPVGKYLDTLFENSGYSQLWQHCILIFISGSLFAISYLILAKIFIPSNIRLLFSPFARFLEKRRG